MVDNHPERNNETETRLLSSPPSSLSCSLQDILKIVVSSLGHTFFYEVNVMLLAGFTSVCSAVQHNASSFDSWLILDHKSLLSRHRLKKVAKMQ